MLLFLGLQLQLAYTQGPTRDHFSAEIIESEVNTCTIFALSAEPLSSLEKIVCDSTIPNYLADCETYEGKCKPGTVDKINEYLELRGLANKK
jgi:hypothetical protein